MSERRVRLASGHVCTVRANARRTLPRVPVTIDDSCSDARGVSARVRTGDREHVVEVRSHACEPALGDALACAVLLSAMAAGGGAVEIPAPVSAVLLERLPRLAEVFLAWMGPDHDRVALLADVAPARARPAPAASFFSGGVDSFHTVLRHQADLDELIFVRGFDMAAGGPLSEEATTHARTVAAELGLGLIEVDTNLRELTDGLVDWDFAHGALLAAIAHTLGRAGRVLVPGTLDERQTAPWGSHPVTDPWWGSEAIDLVPDGTDATRLDKIAAIAEHDVALRHLRVCYENAGGRWHTRPPDGPFNCGRCGKCLKTILGLHLAGALERCPTLPHHLDVDAWLALPPLPIAKIVARATRADFNVSNERLMLERAEADATVPREITAQLRRRMAPFDRLEDDPDALERLLTGVRGTPQADAPKPAGYRLADAASSFLARHPTLRRAARSTARTVAGFLDRARGTTPER